jgi:hypothetical protein
MELTVKQGTSASQLKKLLSKLTGTPRHVRTSHRRGGLDSLLGRGGKGSQQAASSKPAQGGVLSQILQKHPGAATGKPNAP